MKALRKSLVRELDEALLGSLIPPFETVKSLEWHCLGSHRTSRNDGLQKYFHPLIRAVVVVVVVVPLLSTMIYVVHVFKPSL